MVGGDAFFCEDSESGVRMPLISVVGDQGQNVMHNGFGVVEGNPPWTSGGPSSVQLPHTYRILTAYLPHAYRILTAYLPHVLRILTAYLRMSSAYLPHTYRVLTAYLPHTYRIWRASGRIAATGRYPYKVFNAQPWKSADDLFDYERGQTYNRIQT